MLGGVRASCCLRYGNRSANGIEETPALLTAFFPHGLPSFVFCFIGYRSLFVLWTVALLERFLACHTFPSCSPDRTSPSSRSPESPLKFVWCPDRSHLRYIPVYRNSPEHDSAPPSGKFHPAEADRVIG